MYFQYMSEYGGEKSFSWKVGVGKNGRSILSITKFYSSHIKAIL